jgi:hypothetical protein
MSQSNNKAVFAISIVIVVFAVIASGGGLLIEDLYQGNPFAKTVWRANDLITLVVAVPLLILAMIFARRGSNWAVPAWIGMLAFMLYNYAFYLFGAYYNKMFLVYTGLFALSIFGLVFGVPRINVDELAGQFRKKLPVRWISAWLVFIAGGLTIVYLLQAFDYLRTGQVPEIIERTGHVTNVIPALDLSLIIPWYALAAVWLWQERDWGYVLAAIVSVEGAAYLLVLLTAAVFAARGGFPGAADELPLWGTFCAGFLITSGYLLAGFGGKKSQ